MTEPNNIVVVTAGGACFDVPHRLDYSFPDHVCCLDCGHVAATALNDGVEPAVAIAAFRSWPSPEDGAA